MAGFKTHITTSTILGVGYGAGAAVMYDVPIPACVLAGGLCSVSGMLPDLDSDSGAPLRESVSFAAAVVPMLMLDRFQQMGLTSESMVLAAGAIYLLIRFGIGKWFCRWTVHRGMFHSIPAMLLVGELTYLVCKHENPWIQVFNAGAVMLGFASHLVLDEIWAIDFRHARLKSSFGTAIKFWGGCWWSNLLTYATVMVLALMMAEDPTTNKTPPGSETPGIIAKQHRDRDLQ
jgi:membrane-bound metal-dependent hydrolase YbcI (DUF457 family)